MCKVSEMIAAGEEDEGEGSMTGGRSIDMDTDDMPLAERLRERLRQVEARSQK